MVSITARNKKKRKPAATSREEARLPSRVPRKSLYIAAGAVLVIVLVCYANALANGFVFDDHVNLQNNPLLRKLENIPRLLISGFRPVREASYAVDFALWGERPFGFHLTNILIHAANALLVFLLMRRLIGDLAGAAAGALIFAIHPIQPDAVTYISGRRDVLFAFFYLASFHSYLSYRRLAGGVEWMERRKSALLYYALFVGCWVLSLLSKEMAASLPMFIFVWNFCDAWPRDVGSWARRLFGAAREAFRRDRWLYLILLLAVPAYVAYSVFEKGSSTRARLTGFNYWGGSFYANVLTVIRVHAWYLKQLIYPTPIVQYYGAFDVSTSLFEFRVILAMAVVGAVIIGGFVLLGRNRLMAFAVLSYFVLLLPVSQIIPHHELLADHYMYLPLMCFGLFVGVLVQKLSERGERAKRLVYSTAAVILAVLMVMTVSRNRVYRNDLTLWQANYAEVPNSIRALFNLGSASEDSYPARAAELYKRCIALAPSYAPAYVRLAMLYQIKEKAREVQELAERGLALPDPQINAPGYDNPLRTRSDLTTALAISKGFQGRPKEAEEHLLKAIELYPSNQQAYELLAGYYHTADRAKELEILKRQDSVLPNNYYTLQTLSLRLIEVKKYDDAMPYLDRMLAMTPGDFYTNYQLGQIYRTRNDCARARQHLNIARPAASGADDVKTLNEAFSQLQEQCGGS